MLSPLVLVPFLRGRWPPHIAGMEMLTSVNVNGYYPSFTRLTLNELAIIVAFWVESSLRGAKTVNSRSRWGKLWLLQPSTLCWALLLGTPQSCPCQTVTQTLAASLGPIGKLSLPASVALKNSGTTFATSYTGTVSVSYKVRTSASTGSGAITAQATSDFSPTTGPKVSKRRSVLLMRERVTGYCLHGPSHRQHQFSDFRPRCRRRGLYRHRLQWNEPEHDECHICRH